jgi:hypothetical protein
MLNYNNKAYIIKDFTIEIDGVDYCIDMVDHIKKYCIKDNTGQDIDFHVEKMMEDLDKL